MLKVTKVKSADTAESPDTKLVTPAFIKSPEYKTLYANYLQTSHSPFDISFVLGETVGVQDGDILVEQKARVVVAPAEAKVIVSMLQNVIRQYEAQFGAIKMPGVEDKKEHAE